jgi:hypothetical protein
MMGIWESEAGYQMEVLAEMGGLFSCCWIGLGEGFMCSKQHILNNFKRVYGKD